MKIKMATFTILGCIVTLTAYGLVPTEKEITGKCIAVYDGDTCTMLDGNKEVEIRFDEIDCPEKEQSFGTIARDVSASLILDQEIHVKWSKKDRYNRLLGTVYCGHKLSINEILLRCGLAWHYKEYSKNEHFAQLQKEAQEQYKGLWSNPPIQPSIYRKKKRGQ